MRRVQLVLGTLSLLACGASSPAAVTPTPSPDTVSGTINVFAAASLTAPFKDEAAAFRARHSRATVQLNFGGSATLVTQINQGAPADVFASADLPNMLKAVTAGNTIGEPANFATNKLQIVVGAGNPKRIRGLSDLATAGIVVVLCAPAVPCGNYTHQVLGKSGVSVTPKSQEQDVNAVVSRVALGEADAGIVYATDVRAAGARVQGVEIPAGQNVIAAYPIATVKGGSNPGGGKAFADFVLSAAGQAILAGYGFAKP